MTGNISYGKNLGLSWTDADNYESLFFGSYENGLALRLVNAMEAGGDFLVEPSDATFWRNTNSVWMGLRQGLFIGSGDPFMSISFVETAHIDTYYNITNFSASNTKFEINGNLTSRYFCNSSGSCVKDWNFATGSGSSYNVTYNGLINNVSYLSTGNRTLDSWVLNYSNGVAVPWKLSAGSVTAPSLTFASDQDNGLYYVTTNRWGLTAGGKELIDVNNQVASYHNINMLVQNDTETKLWAKSSYINLPSEAIADIGMTGGFYDRNQLTFAGLRPGGSIGIILTNGTSTEDPNKLVDANTGNYYTVSNVNQSTTLTVILNRSSNAGNFGSAQWMPFVQTRLDTIAYATTPTYFKNISVWVSSDCTTWYQPASGAWNTTNFENDSQVDTYWFGGLAQPLVTGSVWKCAKFEFKNPVMTHYSANTSIWISEIGVRHVGEDFAPQFLKKDGGEVYGQTNFTTSHVSGIQIFGSLTVNKTVTNTNASAWSGWNLCYLPGGVLGHNNATSCALSNTNCNCVAN
jgi:hypothetical protein